MGKILKNTKIAKQNRYRVNFHRQWKKILTNEAITSQINLQANTNGSSQQQIQNERQTVQSENENIQTTEEKLRFWVFKHNVSRIAVSDLLKILISIGITWLPRDSRTLLATPRNVEISTLSIGHLWYKVFLSYFSHLYEFLPLN